MPSGCRDPAPLRGTTRVRTVEGPYIFLKDRRDLPAKAAARAVFRDCVR